MHVPGKSCAVQRTVCLVAKGGRLDLHIVNSRVLVSKPRPTERATVPRAVPPGRTSGCFVIGKVLRSRRAGRPVGTNAVKILTASVNDVAGTGKRFQLALPSSLHQSALCFSRLNCRPHGVRTSLLTKRRAIVALSTGVVPVRRIMIHVIGPLHLLQSVGRGVQGGCPRSPTCLAAFCQRKVRQGGGFMKLARTMFGVCGSTCGPGPTPSRIGLLGVHQVVDRRRGSAVVTQVGSKVGTDLDLSLVGRLPSFLLASRGVRSCVCTSSSVTIVSSQLTRIVCFRRGKGVGSTLCQKRLCVSARGGTLLHTRFRVGPGCVGRTAKVLIRGGDHGLGVAPRGIVCAMACGPCGNRCCVGRIQNSLFFEVGGEGRLFKAFPLRA